MIRRTSRSILILALGYLFGGLLGLAVAVALVALRELAHVRTRFLWLTSVLAMVAAPAAAIAQGLPSTPVVGIRLTAVHVLSHRLVTVSLILVIYAALVEMSEPESVDASPLIRRRVRPPRAPRAEKPRGKHEAPPVAAVVVPTAAEDVAEADAGAGADAGADPEPAPPA